MKYLKSATVSVVIPCYNEEENIVHCLKTIEVQTLKPLEVIVVDNNCTDNTVKLARTFKNVRIVKESKQGLIAARNRGTLAAHGDILARIDADSRPSPTWIATITDLMGDQNIQACTGTGYFYDFPFKYFSRGIRNIFAVRLNRLILGHDMLWGSNMVVRAAAWKTIYSELCEEANIMEDLDIAMHLADKYGPKSLLYDSDIQVDISFRRGGTGMVQNYMYLKMWPDTVLRHRGLRSQMLWPAIAFLMATTGPVVNTISRFYDGRTNKWSLDRHRLRHKNGFKRNNP